MNPAPEALVSSLVEVLNRMSESWAGLAQAVVWQSTLLAIFVAILARRLARSSPTLRYWIWQVVALKMLVMPLWMVAIPMMAIRAADLSGNVRLEQKPAVTGLVVPMTHLRPFAEAGMPAATATGRAPRVAAGAWDISWRSWWFLTWLGLVAWRLIVLARQRSALGAVIRRSSPLDDARWHHLVNDVSVRIGLQTPPRVIVAEMSGSPFVCGLRRPTLVLPRDLLGALNVPRWRQVLLHELAHIRRGDLVWGWIPEIAKLLYVFHPVAHWVAWQTRLERELACDAVALAFGGLGASAYADTLVEVATLTSRPPVFLDAALARRDAAQNRADDEFPYPPLGADAPASLGT